MRSLLALLFCCAFLQPSFAQQDLLQSGPMVGYSKMREVMLWVQTTEAAAVKIGYRPTGTEEPMKFTNTVSTISNTSFTAHLLADQVEPGNTYDYQVFINEKAVELSYPAQFQSQVLWQYRTDPPAVKFAVGSCFYINEPAYDRPGKGYGSGYEILTSIQENDPDFMLWMGDNIYLREVDYDSRTGIHKRYTHTRSLPELQPFLAATHHYATWDDHDFGPNDSDRSYIHKDWTLEAFKNFWANPSYGLPDHPGGITSQFQWADLDIFILDNRYFRSPNNRNTTEPTILGKEQLEWLIDALTFSKGSFKIIMVGGQVLSTAPAYENFSNNHAEERAYLLKRIEEEGIQNVVFLTGDRHHTELSKYPIDREHSIYDLTVSPLTSGASTNRGEVNGLRVPDTGVFEHNFGLVEVTGPWGERTLQIQIMSREGEQLWEYSIPQAKK
ncbi:MAG: alkaline phosphatase D family protein [Bacteroidota bacterium]